METVESGRDCLRLCLRVRDASRSFANMRVEAVEKIPKRTARAEAAADAAATLAIKNFVAALQNNDSLFALLEPLEGPARDGESSERTFFGDIVVGFKQEEFSRQRGLQFLLVEKMIELLREAGSKDTLEAKLCLTSQHPLEGEGGQKQHALCVRLLAKGDSAEQAALRWGLGLAHLQQALLFTSRHLRQYLKQADD